jgi:predicted Fe-Mo cluster-binding NifX family protein
MKLALAHWQGRISPVFDVADRLVLITIEAGRDVRRENLRLHAREAFARSRKLAELGVDVLLCGAVSLTLEKALIGAGIRVIGFLGGEMEPILQAFLEGRLRDGRERPGVDDGRRAAPETRGQTAGAPPGERR